MVLLKSDRASLQLICYVYNRFMDSNNTRNESESRKSFSLIPLYSFLYAVHFQWERQDKPFTKCIWPALIVAIFSKRVIVIRCFLCFITSLSAAVSRVLCTPSPSDRPLRTPHRSLQSSAAIYMQKACTAVSKLTTGRRSTLCSYET